MVNMPLDAPLTRREYHMELMVVWLFVVLATSTTLGSRDHWTSVLVPLGALGMVALHAIALRRGSKVRSKPTTSADQDTI